MTFSKSKISYWLLIVLAVLVAMSSHPWIVGISRSAGIMVGSVLSRYIIAIFGCTFVLLLNFNKLLNNKDLRVYFYFLLWIAIYSIITLGSFSNNNLLSALRPLVISFVAIYIGWMVNIDEKSVRILLIVYSVATLYVGYVQVMQNNGGFVISNQYMVDNKNALGIMLATSFAFFSYLGFEPHSKKIYSILCWFVAISLLLITLTIRARASSLISFFIFFLFLYRRTSRKNFVWSLIAVVVFLCLALIFLPSGVRQYIYSSFFQGYEGGDITSDRSYRNSMALDFLSSHPFLGNLRHTSSNFGWIHNYPLLQLFNNGVIFAFPILLLYFYLFVRVFVSSIRCRMENIREVGYFALLIPFISSLAEPTFPYGPGTATVFNFILFGIALRNTKKEERI